MKNTKMQVTEAGGHYYVMELQGNGVSQAFDTQEDAEDAMNHELALEARCKTADQVADESVIEWE